MSEKGLLASTEQHPYQHRTNRQLGHFRNESGTYIASHPISEDPKAEEAAEDVEEGEGTMVSAVSPTDRHSWNVSSPVSPADPHPRVAAVIRGVPWGRGAASENPQGP